MTPGNQLHRMLVSCEITALRRFVSTWKASIPQYFVQTAAIWYFAKWTLWDQLLHSVHRVFYFTLQSELRASIFPFPSDLGTRRKVLRANFSPCLLYALFSFLPFQSETVFFFLLWKMMLCVLTTVRVKFTDLERETHLFIFLSAFVYIPIVTTAQWKDNKKQSVLIVIDSSLHNFFLSCFVFSNILLSTSQELQPTYIQRLYMLD